MSSPMCCRFCRPVLPQRLLIDSPAPNSSDTASAHQHWISQSASCANVVEDRDSSRNGPSTKAQSKRLRVSPAPDRTWQNEDSQMDRAHSGRRSA